MLFLPSVATLQLLLPTCSSFMWFPICYSLALLLHIPTPPPMVALYLLLPCVFKGTFGTSLLLLLHTCCSPYGCSLLAYCCCLLMFPQMVLLVAPFYFVGSLWGYNQQVRWVFLEFFFTLYFIIIRKKFLSFSIFCTMW